MEQHKVNKESFKTIMPVLSKLDEKETEVLVHLIRNKSRSLDTQVQYTNDLIDDACCDYKEIALAKIAEDATFMVKNRYYHNHTVMKYAEKSKMPIDARKVKDVLRNQNVMRERIRTDVNTYEDYKEHTNFEAGVLTYANEAAFGDMRSLLNDIGISELTLPYAGITEQ